MVVFEFLGISYRRKTVVMDGCHTTIAKQNNMRAMYGMAARHNKPKSCLKAVIATFTFV